jgi:hypothetical protein
MKLSTILVGVIVGVFFVTSPFVNAAVMVRYIFNNGLNQTGMSCNDADTAQIDRIFKFYNFRNLRHGKVEIKDRQLDLEQDIIGKDKERQLVYYPPYCKNNCAGFAKGTCRSTNCLGFRQRELGSAAADRDLQAGCEITKSAIDSNLNWLVAANQVSNSCKAWLMAPRTSECYDDVAYGIIESFNAWDTDRNVILHSNIANGYTVCSSINVNFQAIGNECVVNVEMALTNPSPYNTFFSGSTPYTAFGMMGSRLFGRKMPAGNYTLSATPNRFPSNKKEIKLIVKNC